MTWILQWISAGFMRVGQWWWKLFQNRKGFVAWIGLIGLLATIAIAWIIDPNLEKE